MIRVTVWNENYHEKTSADVRAVHPKGLHETLGMIFKEIPEVTVTCVTQDQPYCGLPDAVLENTDVLVWWGHMQHHLVPDEVVDRIQTRILKGMGLIVLHSGHHSKIFRRMMGTSCDLRWRDGTYERIFCVQPSHPIAEGIPDNFELGTEECYGERFDIPAPDETLFLGWYDIGEVFRSGCVWYRGYGKIFYFQPGHETNRSFFNPHVRRILQNACRWIAPHTFRIIEGAPMIEVTLEEQRLKQNTEEEM